MMMSSVVTEFRTARCVPEALGERSAHSFSNLFRL